MSASWDNIAWMLRLCPAALQRETQVLRDTGVDAAEMAREACIVICRECGVSSETKAVGAMFSILTAWCQRRGELETKRGIEQKCFLKLFFNLPLCLNHLDKSSSKSQPMCLCLLPVYQSV